jgi:hypothetical protein
MKKFAVIALTLLPALAFAQDANRMKYVELLKPTSAASSSNSAVDVSAYKGNAAFVVQFAPATEAACVSSVTLKHSATAGGAYVTVTNIDGTACAFSQTGPATTAVQTVSIDLARVHPYVRAYTAHTTQTNALSALLVAPMKAE